MLRDLLGATVVRHHLVTGRSVTVDITQTKYGSRRDSDESFVCNV